jgi:hypothetical protein
MASRRVSLSRGARLASLSHSSAPFRTEGSLKKIKIERWFRVCLIIFFSHIHLYDIPGPVVPLNLLLFASAYVSIRQHTSAYVSIRQHTSTCVNGHLKTTSSIMHTFTSRSSRCKSFDSRECVRRTMLRLYGASSVTGSSSSAARSGRGLRRLHVPVRLGRFLPLQVTQFHFLESRTVLETDENPVYTLKRRFILDVLGRTPSYLASMK